MFLFGCNEKTYTVEDFKNNKALLDEYQKNVSTVKFMVIA